MKFKIGDRVKVIDGTLKDEIVTIIEFNNHGFDYIVDANNGEGYVDKWGMNERNIHKIQIGFSYSKGVVFSL